MDPHLSNHLFEDWWGKLLAEASIKSIITIPRQHLHMPWSAKSARWVPADRVLDLILNIVFSIILSAIYCIVGFNKLVEGFTLWDLSGPCSRRPTLMQDTRDIFLGVLISLILRPVENAALGRYRTRPEIRMYSSSAAVTMWVITAFKFGTCPLRCHVFPQNEYDDEASCAVWLCCRPPTNDSAFQHFSFSHDTACRHYCHALFESSKVREMRFWYIQITGETVYNTWSHTSSFPIMEFPQHHPLFFSHRDRCVLMSNMQLQAEGLSYTVSVEQHNNWRWSRHRRHEINHCSSDVNGDKRTQHIPNFPTWWLERSILLPSHHPKLLLRELLECSTLAGSLAVPGNSDDTILHGRKPAGSPDGSDESVGG